LPDNHTVQSNKEIFKIIMDNLLTNAIKFTPDRGKITIGIEDETDSSIKFFVQDSWSGIPPDVDPFAYGYTTPWLDGQVWTGIWLAQSKIFAKVVWWAIWHQDAPGWGTIFFFALRKTLPKQGE
jgi:signal transduction histidine kinase